MTDKTREDVVEAVARAINPDVWGLLDLFRGDRQRIDEFQRAELDMSIHAAKRVIAALNTRPDVEAGQMAFNVNEAVWVKLTDEGRRQHRARQQQQYPMLKYRAPDESDDGWSKWQLWVLMRELGPGISMGVPPLFDTTIRLAATAIRSLPLSNKGESRG